MISIFVFGLDQFAVGEYSRNHTANIANLFETGSDQIDFLAPDLYLFHEGVEQTSWNCLVLVRAPAKFRLFEAKVAQYLMDTLTNYAVHISCEFEYFEEGRRYESQNKAYPHFMSKGDLPTEEESEELEEDSDESEDENPNPRDRADLDPNDPNQIYLGNAFADFEKKMKERADALSVDRKEKAKEEN